MNMINMYRKKTTEEYRREFEKDTLKEFEQ